MMISMNSSFVCPRTYHSNDMRDAVKICMIVPWTVSFYYHDKRILCIIEHTELSCELIPIEEWNAYEFKGSMVYLQEDTNNNSCIYIAHVVWYIKSYDIRLADKAKWSAISVTVNDLMAIFTEGL